MLDWRLYPELDESGKVKTVLGISRDITQNIESENALKINEHRFNIASAGGNIGVWDWYPQTGELVWSDEMYRVFGFSPGACEPSYELFINMVHPDDKQRTEQAVDLALNQQQPYDLDLRIVKKDGNEIFANARGEVQLDSNNKPLRMLGTFQNITERKRAEEALRINEDRLEKAMSVTNDGVYDWDVSTNVVYFSPRYYTMSGYLPDEFPGTFDEWAQRVHPEDFKRVQPAVTAFLTDEIPKYDEEFRFRCKDGSWMWIRARIEVVSRGKDGAPLRMIGTHTDITESKLAQREREKLIAKLGAQNEELERFAYTVSHDLKSPLVTIKGYIGMLTVDIVKEDQEAIDEDLSYISSAADTMAGLLNDVLELSRVGRQANSLQEIPLDQLANEVLKLVHGQIQEKNVQVQVLPKLPIIYGDRLRLLEVLQNLIDNAIKYMGDQPNPKVEIGASNRDGHTVYFVKDNGIGIASNYRETIFGLFDQLDPRIEGSGIGLALVKRIIEVHQGRIWVESEGLGHGSTFYFTLAPKPHSNNS
ncbi:MAG: PAS domain-containing sensor histidine kinase [Pirellulales bacterium]